MKKVQDATKQDKALNELCKRYEDRGRNYNDSPEYAEQETREILTRSVAPKSYKISGGNVSNLHKYKNGVAGGRKYMTEGDFANYYKATREYTPEANVELDTTVLLQKIDRDRYKKNAINTKTEKNDVKAKLRAEANRSNPKGLKPKASEKKPTTQKPKRSIDKEKIKEVAREAARTWIPLEEMHTEKIVEGTKTKIPKNVIFAIIVITVSLMLIVTSAVLLSSARSEQNELKDAIELLDKEIAELETDLNKKNEEADIEIFAEEVLGMIKQEYVNAEYIDSNKTDGVNKEQQEKVSFASLINWIFKQFK